MMQENDHEKVDFQDKDLYNFAYSSRGLDEIDGDI